MKHHNPTFEELSDWKPAVCFYWSDVVKLSQFGIWKPYMKRSAQRIIIWSDSKEVTPKSLGAEMPFAYIWDISSEQLSDAIASAANDIELKSNREHEFTRYYSGFESINESAKHFDQVLQQVTTKKSFRIPSFVRSRILKLLSIK